MRAVARPAAPSPYPLPLRGRAKFLMSICASGARGAKWLGQDALVEDVAAVLGEGANLPRPASLVHRGAPARARQHLRALDLVGRRVGRLVLHDDGLLLPADDHGQRRLLEP